MRLVQQQPRSWIEVRGIPIAQLSALTVQAIRVWTDARGKTHFDYTVTLPTRAPGQCAHRGTWVRRGQAVAYTWARSARFDGTTTGAAERRASLLPGRAVPGPTGHRLHCGDCGAVLA